MTGVDTLSGFGYAPFSMPTTANQKPKTSNHWIMKDLKDFKITIERAGSAEEFFETSDISSATSEVIRTKDTESGRRFLRDMMKTCNRSRLKKCKFVAVLLQLAGYNTKPDTNTQLRVVKTPTSFPHDMYGKEVETVVNVCVVDDSRNGMCVLVVHSDGGTVSHIQATMR